ncbi:hypothetical protein AAY473_011253 [Plecturocebus cupreus]
MGFTCSKCQSSSGKYDTTSNMHNRLHQYRRSIAWEPIRNITFGRARWLRPVIPALWEAKTGGSQATGRLKQENHLNPESRGCSEPRSCHCSPAWVRDTPPQNKKRKKESENTSHKLRKNINNINRLEAKKMYKSPVAHGMVFYIIRGPRNANQNHNDTPTRRSKSTDRQRQMMRDNGDSPTLLGLTLSPRLEGSGAISAHCNLSLLSCRTTCMYHHAPG